MKTKKKENHLNVYIHLQYTQDIQQQKNETSKMAQYIFIIIDLMEMVFWHSFEKVL